MFLGHDVSRLMQETIRLLRSFHDNTAARKAYQDFFNAWKNADPDVPVLKEARAEYAKLAPSAPLGHSIE